MVAVLCLGTGCTGRALDDFWGSGDLGTPDARNDASPPPGDSGYYGDGLPPEKLDVVLTKNGDPAWKPVGFQLLSARVGTAADGFQDSRKVWKCVISEPEHVFNAQAKIMVPGKAHPPPYDKEAEQGVKKCGYVSRKTFTTDEFKDPFGVFIFFIVIPIQGKAPTGSSPDFTSGPIMPNALFPMSTGAELWAGTIRIGSGWKGSYKSTNALGVKGEGHSHLPYSQWVNFKTITNPAEKRGKYTFRHFLTDSAGAGWTIDIRFDLI